MCFKNFLFKCMPNLEAAMRAWMAGPGTASARRHAEALQTRDQYTSLRIEICVYHCGSFVASTDVSLEFCINV